MAIASMASYWGANFALEGPKQDQAALKENNPAKITTVSHETFETAVNKEIWILRTYKKIEAFFVDPNKPSWINAIVGEARAVFGVTKHFFKILERASKIFASTQLTHIISLPFDLHSFVMRFYDLAVGKGLQEKIDALLGTVGDISSLGDGITTVITALAEIGAIAQNAMAWAGPLNIASNLLSAIFYVINGRSLYFSSKVQKELNQKLKGPGKPDYRGAVDVLKKHNYALKNHSGVSMQILDEKIAQVFKEYRLSKATQTEKDEKFDAQMKQVFSNLQKRIVLKQASIGLGITTTTIGILATIIFAFSPLCALLAAVGASFLAVMYFIVMGKLIHDIYANALFNRKMKQIKPFSL